VTEFSGPADTGVVGCTDQRLHDGIELADLPLFYTLTQPNHSWGSREMVEVLVDTARHMRWLLPDADPITIGDISSRTGGPLSGHKSHRGGVDADIGIYLNMNDRNGVQDPRQFLNPGPGGFDVEANWTLLSTLLDTGKIDMILLDRQHILRLRAYALQAGLLSDEEADQMFPGEGTRGSWENVGIVRHAPNHQDHLHVRVLCPDGSKPN
jgi:hypothetical protein